MTARRRSELVALIVLVGFLIGAVAAYVQAYYFGRGYPHSTFLFTGADKFVPNAPSLGNHLFGDLYAVWRHTRDPSPYLQSSLFFPSNYLPFTHTLFTPLSTLTYPIAAAVYFATTSTAMAAIVWRQIRVDDRVARALLTLIIAGLTYPFLFTQDRGNIDIVMFIALWLMLESLLAGRWWFAAVFLAVAASIKGTPALLVLLFVPVRRWVEGVAAGVIAVAFTIVSFAVMSGGAIKNFEGFLDALRGFNVIAEQGTFSVQHCTSIHGILSVLEHWWGGNLTSAGPVISLIVLALAITGSLFLPLALWERVTLLVVAIVLVPRVSGDYRLMLMILPLALALSPTTARDVPRYALVLFGLLMIPKGWPILWADVGLGSLVNPIIMLALGTAVLVRGAARRRGGADAFAPGSPVVL